MSDAEKERLHKAHCIRMRVHWGKNYDVSLAAWPQSRADWEQTGHGAPWDTNVHMARFALQLGSELQKAGLL